jgi:hypothetical protein
MSQSVYIPASQLPYYPPPSQPPPNTWNGTNNTWFR